MWKPAKLKQLEKACIYAKYIVENSEKIFPFFQKLSSVPGSRTLTKMLSIQKHKNARCSLKTYKMRSPDPPVQVTPEVLLSWGTVLLFIFPSVFLFTFQSCHVCHSCTNVNAKEQTRNQKQIMLHFGTKFSITWESWI